jgi:hypothetical protein
MIQTMTIADAFAVQVPKHIILNNDVATVYTGADIPPAPQREWSLAEFNTRFTPAELAGFWLAASTDPQAAKLMATAFSSPTIRPDSQELIDALEYWVSIGKLAVNRPAEIRS